MTKNIVPRIKPKPYPKKAKAKAPVILDSPLYIISLEDIKKINELAASKGFGEELVALGISVEPLID